VATVQRDETAGKALPEFADIPLRGIEGMRVDATRAQRLQHAGAGHQRNLALRRMPPIRTATLPKFELFWLIPSVLWSFNAPF
jgi:hypothetical protein